MPQNLTRLFLEPVGWLKAKKEQAPVRADGTPLPWFTYGAIEFLQQVVRPTDRVFEYGAGYSTLWWQEHAAQIESVEHDIEWCERLKPRLAENVRLESRPIDSPYTPYTYEQVTDFFKRPRRTEWRYDEAKVIRRGLEDERFIAYATRLNEIDHEGEGFDFIIVDGMARRLCTWVAVKHLKSDGFLILDNSNRSDYDLAYTILHEEGFHQIPCWGLVPGADFLTNTSFFTRSLKRLPLATFSGNSFHLPEY